MREWLARLVDWFRRDTLDRELSEELHFHQRQLARDARLDGVADAEAAYAASRRLGNRLRVREDARDRWSIPSLDRVQQDLRYALRGLRRSPGFTATAVVTLALGIGANAAMFDVVDRLMFRPLAYLRDPGTVHRLYWQRDERGTTRTVTSSPYTRYLDMTRWTTSFSQLATFSERPLAVGDGEEARELQVGVVSASFFGFFDARPALGRFFVADEDVPPRGADVAVLSHAYWRSELGGRDVLGQTLRVGNLRTTIVGVAPAGFDGVNDANPPAVYIPITTYAGNTGTDDAKTYYTRYDWGWAQTMVRRKPGVSVEQASADATNAFRRSWEASLALEPGLPATDVAQPRAVVSALRPGGGPNPALEARTALWVSAVAAIVLCVAVANVANLSLARAARRQRETAVRIALGVSRARLVRQSLAESLILAVLGAAAALLVAQWAGAAIRRLLITTQSIPVQVYSDARTLVVTLGIALVVGVLVGLAPLAILGRGDAFASLDRGLARTLRGGARGGNADGVRLRAALIVAQAALSVALLVGTALFTRSLAHVKAMPMGYDPDQVLLVNLVTRGAFPGDSAIRAQRDLLLAEASVIPAVDGAAWISSAPFVSTSSTSIFVSGIDSTARLGTFTYQATTPDYFRVMGTRITRGRAFTAEDRFGAPNVGIVSESMARALWPQRDALGQCFRVRADTMPCTIVVGIAEDMVQRDIAGDARYHFYLPIDQFRRTSGRGLLVRMRTDPVQGGEDVRRALQRVLPGTAYLTVQPLRTIVEEAQRPWRLGATMFGAFGVLALIVAGIGLYGVVSYGVTQRLHELGVRAALGARPVAIVRLVVGQSLRYAVAGIVVGTMLALAAARWIEPLLFRQTAADPAVYGIAAVAMIVVAIVASAWPASRAARVDPVDALREG